MGYTHYWKQKRSLTDGEWAKVTEIVRKVCEATDVQLRDGLSREHSSPEFDEAYIGLNGDGEDSHETFYLTPQASDFEFCKTVRKPYDEVVVACLMLINENMPDGVFSWSSDGEEEDWVRGIALAEKIIFDFV